MALNSSPRSGSSGSRSRRTAQSNRRSSGASSRRQRGSAGKPIKGKRKSVAGKTGSIAKSDASSSRSTRSRRDSAASTRASGRGSSRSSYSSSSTSGRRVGDIRAREREQRIRSHYRKFVMRIVIVVAAVLLVIFGSIFVYRSDLFHVNNVQINGVSHLTSQEITEIAAVPADSTLLRLDAAGIKQRLEDNAWVQSATIHRSLPDTIVIDVTERTPGAVVRINDKQTWVISTDSSWLSAATEDDWNNDMRIIDVSNSIAQPVSGSECTDGGIKNALAILDGISDDLKSQIQSISAESSIKTSLNLKNGITVAFGDSSNIQLKEAAINELLSQYAGKISYINVRVPASPTYRTLDATSPASSEQDDADASSQEGDSSDGQ
ncbi:MAG: FtsQ-type POTRA domain-containing protein [Coriobacteriales bacterium]|nr:FtsQ-type POTRA domain-containing protein [Coriobacteriales bacterium]MDY5662615.1 FtsQ-type POTRA domain-containing protein [Coriobacteriales bacterium]